MSSGGLAISGQQLARLRWHSKRLFVSQYRLEVAEAIRNLENGWTIQELKRKTAEMDELPQSCVVKEVTALLELGYLDRGAKTAEGYRYQRSSSIPLFWNFVQQVCATYFQPGNLLELPTTGTLHG